MSFADFNIFIVLISLRIKGKRMVSTVFNSLAILKKKKTHKI